MKCHCEFCWVCRTLTTNHGHCGNAVPPKYQSKEMGGDTRRNLEKFDNFFVKFREHNRSDEIERTLRENIREYQFVMNSKAVNMRLVELVEEAMENLLECRRILKYTYVHSFYLKTVVEKQFFKFLQDDCEKSTELLSQALSVDSLEMDIDDIRAKSNVAATRIMNLID
jgi:ariadne-1